MPPSQLELPELTPTAAFWRGVITTMVVAFPVGVFNQWLVDSGEIKGGSPGAIFFWLLILFGGAAGGWAVIRLSPSAPLWLAAGAAAFAYGAVQALGVLKRLIWGPHEFSPLGYVFLAMFMAVCGTLGGMFGRRWHRTAPLPDSGHSNYSDSSDPDSDNRER